MIIASDPFVDYASYDTDNNGHISTTELHIIVIVAGHEAATGGAIPSVWGHRWSLGFGSVSAPIVDGVSVGNYFTGGGYAQFGEWHGTVGYGHMATIGIMVHELGHDLSWPDLYDIDRSSNGVGYWSVMGSGSWLGLTDPGDTPGHVSAWEKWYQGWLSPVQLHGTHLAYPLPRVEDNKTNSVVQLLDNPAGVDWEFGQASGTGEFFLVENRQKVGYDAALLGCGLLIWHIDESVTSTNSANANESQKLADVEEADGQNHLDNKTNRGDAGDLFPGSSNNTTFDNSSNPNSKLYDNSASGISVTNISPGCADTKTADFTAPGATTGTIIVEKQTLPDGISGSFEFTGDASGTISDDGQIIVSNLAPGSYSAQEAVTAGSVLTGIVCDDSNSNGNLSSQTATFVLEAGETVKCTFTNTMDPYSLTVDIVGNGDVLLSPDQTTYYYGDVVTLTPVADSGWKFVEWRGDVNGTTDPTVVTMDGDKNVTATFELKYAIMLPFIVR